MKTKILAFGILAAALLSVFVFQLPSSSAENDEDTGVFQNFRENMGCHNRGQKMEKLMEKSPELFEAIANGDYEAWKENLPADSPLASLITEENFPLLTEMHTAMMNGDFSRAKEIREELGLPDMGMGNGPMKGFFEKGPEFAAALEAGDYEAFLALIPEDSPLREFVTEENFSLFREMHTAMKEGDLERAQEIRKELGLPDMGIGRGGMMHRMENMPEVLEAIENGDYEDWKALMPENAPLLDVITEENFARFAEMHEALKNVLSEESHRHHLLRFVHLFKIKDLYVCVLLFYNLCHALSTIISIGEKPSAG